MALAALLPVAGKRRKLELVQTQQDPHNVGVDDWERVG